MARVEKTVFLSYRRTNAPWALSIYQNLTANGFDVFFDYKGIASGDFESVILENIRARAHFLVALTPSALERCADPGDWLRREIEEAIECRRNIVPLLLEGFDFGASAVESQLTGRLAELKKYNGLTLPVEYFDAAMERLRENFLNVPVNTVLQRASAFAREVAKEQQAATGLVSMESEEPKNGSEPVATPIQPIPELGANPPRCFISYSWDSEPHKAWVRKLATRLLESGIEVILDQFECSPGTDLTFFMEKSVRESEFVLLVCTPNFAKKTNANVGGGGYERQIVTGEIFDDKTRGTETKFIPLLREGDAKESLPNYLKSRLFVDFRDDAVFKNGVEELLRHFYGERLYPKPIIGSRPNYRTRSTPKKPKPGAIEEKIPINKESGHPDLDSMVKVPAGEFIYQNGKAKIEKPYMIDVYPVTNSQFRKFIEAGGYKNLNFWSAEGQKWLKKSKASAPAYWNDEKWNQPEHPVVGVSFYEAEAYAEWSGKRLPTEKEWERAARATDGRKYPWGNEFDPERCNTSESEIGSTTPVTQCPKGISLVGCYDLAGNVWEWCQGWYDESKSEKIFRGGSWNYYQDNAECSNRFKCHSYGRDNDIGFRCVRDLG